MSPYISALTGGLIIGLSSSILLLSKGRIFGISGIIGGMVKPQPGDILWRILIVLGLLTGGFLAQIISPDSFPSIEVEPMKLIVAGLLVGFGTQMGGGCTSGHGVCGISRFSPRSLVATIVFIASGVLAVLMIKLGGLG